MESNNSGLETQVFSTQAIADSLGQDESPKDLGFGALVTRKTKRRLLNRDGSFNVHRAGYSFFRSRSMYHFLLNSSWTLFFGTVTLAYLIINIFFAVLFYLSGSEAIAGGSNPEVMGRFADCFFFSIQTFATIGYGKMTPVGLIPNLFVTLETLVGLLSFALATGMFFARISRPTAMILFSKTAVVAPYRGRTAFEFRIVNERKNQMTHLEAKVVMSRLERDGAMVRRKFHNLELERKEVLFFPLHWTIVHPIDEDSPLYGITEEELRSSDVEFLVLLTGMDDTFSQTVNAWSSYKDDDIIWGARYANILEELDDGSVKIDLCRIHETERTPLPPIPKKSAAA